MEFFCSKKGSKRFRFWYRWREVGVERFRICSGLDREVRVERVLELGKLSFRFSFIVDLFGNFE